MIEIINIISILVAIFVVITFRFLYPRFWHIPLKTFGIENVQRVLRWESSDRREKIWRQGWMTSHEWQSILNLQLAAFSAELQRRGARGVGDAGHAHHMGGNDERN